MTLPRWVAAVSGVVLFVVSVALALAGVPDAISGPGDVFSNLGRNLITTLAVALLAYVWFSFGTSYSAMRRVRGEARRRPERLFPVPPRVGNSSNVFGRKRLVDQVATNLKREFRTGPQVIIGETGSGKTSLLLALAAHFAQHDVYPIVLSLRDVEEINFAASAEKRFKEHVDPYVRAEADADKLWRWVCRRGQIVVLADDLDRAKVSGMADDPYKAAVRVALEAAGRRRLPLVVASRPEALPPDLNVAPVAIGQLELDPEEATTEVLTRARRGKDDDERNTIRAYIRRGDLTANPFYLGLLVDVLRLPSSPKLPPGDGKGKHAVRVALLERWREGLVDEEIVPRTERRRREQILHQVAGFATARLTPALDAKTDDPAAAERRWLSALHAAERLELVEMDRDGHHRFKHDVLHAFFASRKRGRVLDALNDAPDAPRVQLSVVFAATAGRGLAGNRGPAFCRKACECLIASRGEADERRLLRAAAAAEVANAGGFHSLDERIATTCAAARREASPLIRRAALDEVAKLRGKGVVEALWDFAGDDDYDVRWAAAQKLIDRCSRQSPLSRGGDGEPWPVGLDAYEVLEPIFDQALQSAHGLSGLHDRDPKILALKQMAWILPALRSPAEGWRDRKLKGKRPDELLEQLIEFESPKVSSGVAREASIAQSEGVSSELGLEASIAQGFKVHAMTLITQHADRSGLDGLNGQARHVDKETVNIEEEKRLLSHAEFWYSQLNLLHAITLRVADRVAQGGRLPNQRNRRVVERSTHVSDTILGRGAYIKDTIRGRCTYVRDLLYEQKETMHPYVAAAAALCDRAIDEVSRGVEGLPQDENRRYSVARRTLGRYVWGDEGVLVSQQPAELDKGEVAQVGRARTDGGVDTDRSSGLVDRAIQLVGDIVVLLNMNETGDEGQRNEFAKKRTLPYCMSQSHDRSELFEKCRGGDECRFGLCPYEPAINRASAHRELSRGFCRHQQHHATWRAARAWGSKAKNRKLRESWEELEAKAQM